MDVTSGNPTMKFGHFKFLMDYVADLLTKDLVGQCLQFEKVLKDMSLHAVFSKNNPY